MRIPPEESTRLPDHKVVEEKNQTCNFGKSALQQIEAGFLSPQKGLGLASRCLWASPERPVLQGEGADGLSEADAALLPRKSVTSEKPFLTLCCAVDGRSRLSVPAKFRMHLLRKIN